MPQSDFATIHSPYFQKLNPRQRQAVESIDGPLMVLAGPGTGKTQVIAARIAYILENTDTTPSSILAITFTDAAAKNMRERLVSLIGHAGYYVSVQTFHGFCTEILSQYTELFSIHPGSQALGDVERFEIIENLLEELPLDLLKPINAPRHYAKKIIEAISNLKKEGIDPEAFAGFVASDFAEPPATKSKAKLAKFERDKAKNEELTQVYQSYQEELRSRARYDYDDMIMMVVDAFATHPFLLESIQEQFQYFLVDEYQDTNEAQNQLLWHLSSFWQQAANVCVVGDPHQAIYRFQGASVENTYAFLSKFPQARVITLEKAYRCPQPLYDAAHALISHNTLTAQESTPVEQLIGEQLRQRLISVQAAAAERAAIAVTVPSDVTEWLVIAEKISELLQEGVPAREIAILTKTNAQATRLSDMLRSHGIPTQLSSQLNALDNPTVVSILQLLEVINSLRADGTDTQLLTVLLQPWWSVEPAVTYQLAQHAGSTKTSLYRLLKESQPAELAKKLFSATQDQITSAQQIVTQLETFGQLEPTMAFPVWLRTILDQSGVLTWLKSDITHYPDLLALVSITEHITQWAAERRSYRLTDLLTAIELLIAHEVSLSLTSTTFVDEAVELSTVHAAKGKEWEYVFLPHCTDGIWGNSKRSELLSLPQSVLRYTDLSKKEKNEDERRVFYVALTRARRQVMCTVPQKYLTQGKQRDQVASMFLGEAGLQVEPALLSNSQTECSQSLLATVLAPPAQIEITPAVRRLLSSLIERLRFSASSINTYLRNPEEFLLQNILGLRQLPESHMIYGTAVHAGLEELTKRVVAGASVEIDEILHVLDEGLKRGQLPPSEHLRRLEHGKRVIGTYHAGQHVDPERVLSSERSFGTAHRPLALKDMYLTGRIDRIDWIDPKTKTVRLIDYKLSKPKSINDLAGKTGLSSLSERELALPEELRHPHRRQMVFYKLLTDLDSTFQPTVIAGTFEYIDATQDPMIVQRELSLDVESVEELKTLIMTIAAELKDLSFLDRMRD